MMSATFLYVMKKSKKIDRIIETIDVGLQHSPEPREEVVKNQQETCWRCNAHDASGELGLCEPCLGFMREGKDEQYPERTRNNEVNLLTDIGAPAWFTGNMMEGSRARHPSTGDSNERVTADSDTCNVHQWWDYDTIRYSFDNGSGLTVSPVIRDTYDPAAETEPQQLPSFRITGIPVEESHDDE